MNKNVIRETLDLLSSNFEWKERYANYINYLKDKQPKRFRKPEGLSVYSSVSKFKGETYDLRFAGQSVGLVVSRPQEVLLRPCEEANERYFSFSTAHKKLNWHCSEATRFRKFFRDLANKGVNIRLKSPEHRVENLLLREFAKRTRADNKVITGIQPIKLNGCFFQMPTPIQASSHKPTYARQYGGGIDILARVKLGRETRICVMEVKDENIERESQSKTMEQALSYATFIAALLRSQSGQAWWDFLLGRDSVSKSIPSLLDIDVVTIMPTGKTEEFANEIIEESQLATRFHCHSLYFDNDALAESRFHFSGTFPYHLKQS